MKSIYNDIVVAGPVPQKGSKALVMVHGRGGSAEGILSLADHLNVKEFVRAAPEAENNSWYPFSFMAPVAYNQDHLDRALALIRRTVDSLLSKGIEKKDIFFLGFSQGACLVSEFVARNADHYGGVIIFTGGLIGERIDRANYSGNFNGTRIYLGTADPDPHVTVQRVEDTALILTEMGGAVTKRIFPGMPHTVSMEEMREVNDIFFP